MIQHFIPEVGVYVPEDVNVCTLTVKVPENVWKDGATPVPLLVKSFPDVDPSIPEKEPVPL